MNRVRRITFDARRDRFDIKTSQLAARHSDGFNGEEMTPRNGKEVEVRSRFSGRWVTGFEVAEALQHDRVLLRRRSDGSVLPVPFAAREIRARTGE